MPQTPPNRFASTARATVGTAPAALCPVCRSEGREAFSATDLMFGGTRLYRYLACGSCGAVYQSPMPTLEEIAGFYPPGYAVHQRPKGAGRIGGWRRAVLKYRFGYAHLPVPFFGALLSPLLARWPLKRAVPFVPGGNLLDIGCGNGKFLLTMNALGWEGMGLELSAAAAAVCREAGLTVVEGELAAASFENDRFDLVTARHLIEHLREPAAFVGEVARILKPGGRLALETPNSRALGRSWFGPCWYADDVPRHLVLFHPGNLRRLVEGQGLRLVTSQMSTSPKIFLNSWDYRTRNTGRPSKKRRLRRLLARPYVVSAQLTGRGDTIFQLYEKR